MGWYVTCEICGVIEKYRLGCNCYHQESIKNNEKIIGSTVLDSFIKDDNNGMMYMIQKLKKDDIFYMSINIQSLSGENEEYRKIKTITEEQYLTDKTTNNNNI